MGAHTELVDTIRVSNSAAAESHADQLRLARERSFSPVLRYGPPVSPPAPTAPPSTSVELDQEADAFEYVDGQGIRSGDGASWELDQEGEGAHQFTRGRDAAPRA